MGQSPEELREEIERTRQDLSRDVDLINEKVSPGRIVQRRVDKTKSAVGSIRERVMGTASSGTSAISDKASSAQSTVSNAVGAVGDAPDMARRQAAGNPLAAGLVAFGAGMLIASLLPASQAEQDAAMALQDRAGDLKEPLKEIANEIKDDMQGSAQEAVSTLRDSATEAVQTVQDKGKSSAQTVTSEAKDAGQQVRDAGSS